MGEKTENKRFILFLTFHFLRKEDGITKKILAQQKAFEENGYYCKLGYLKYINNKLYYIIDNEKIYLYGKGFLSKIKLRLYQNNILKWILSHKNNIIFIYLRYNQIANPFYTFLFNKINKYNIKLIVEIPTYPYDQELKPRTIFNKIDYFLEKKYRKKFFSNFSYIVTYSDDNLIFNTPTIKINNGIDLETIPLRNHIRNINEINLIGVAGLSFWHGFDRIIEGLYNYYRGSYNKIVNFYIIGGNQYNLEFKRLSKLIKNYNLDNHVFMIGEKYGKELDYYFNLADLAIGSLGRHRTGITQMQSLKNVEYAARDLPFTYSENNNYFDNTNFIIKFSQDDSPIDINLIIDFLNNFNYKTGEIRNFASPLTWKVQIKKILESIQF